MKKLLSFLFKTKTKPVVRFPYKVYMVDPHGDFRGYYMYSSVKEIPEYEKDQLIGIYTIQYEKTLIIGKHLRGRN